MGGKIKLLCDKTALNCDYGTDGMLCSCKKSEMPIFDQIFTRIGASDDIMSGQSTFMVEMMEANNALQNATANSLILFDEIGRGTSTYDGMALAQAMIEYIVQNIKAKTLFSTHYHELTEMAEKNSSIYNVHVDVHEEDEKVTFLYRVVDGKADKSYGINVARLAHLPNAVLERAASILSGLEQIEMTYEVPSQVIPYMVKEDPIKEELYQKLKQVDVNRMTPMEALQCLYDLKESIQKK